jgi:hypothetical protein
LRAKDTNASRVTTQLNARGADGHRLLGAVLTHLGVAASLTEPEAAIALANGVPNLDDETLVRFLYDSRYAA